MRPRESSKEALPASAVLESTIKPSTPAWIGFARSVTSSIESRTFIQLVGESFGSDYNLLFLFLFLINLRTGTTLWKAHL